MSATIPDKKSENAGDAPRTQRQASLFPYPPYVYLVSGLFLILCYILISRDLNFFVPLDFTYFAGPQSLVPISEDLTRTTLRHFAPSFLASVFWKVFLLFPAAVLLSVFFMKRCAREWLDGFFGRLASIRPGYRLSLFSIIGLVLILLLILFAFQKTHVTDDENAYLFQAKIIERGSVAAPPPPVKKSFDNWFIITDKMFTGKYTLCYPAVLALGHLVTGTHYALPVILAVLTIALTYFIGRELYDRVTGLLAAFLLTLSPLFLFNSATLLSHCSTLFFLSLFMYSYLAGIRKRSILLGLAAGVAIGIAFNIRQLTAIGFGFPFAIYLVWRMVRDRRGLAGFFLFCTGGFALLVLFTMWYNRVVSGSLFTFPFNIYDPMERLGFGAMLDNFRYTHTPLRGIQNLLVSAARMNLWFLGIPLSLVFLLPLFLGWDRKMQDRWGLGIIVTFCVAYLFYYSPGVPETGPIYYFELLVPLSLMSSRGILIFQKKLEKVKGDPHLRYFPAVFLSISLALGLVSFYPEKVLHIAALTDRIKEPYDLVERKVEEPTLVFIRSLPQAGWVFGYKNTDPWLEGPLLFCRDLGPEKNLEVIRHFPERHYYLLFYDPEIGQPRIRSFTMDDLHKILQSNP